MVTFNLNDLPPKHRRQAQAQLDAQAAGKSANVEPSPPPEPVAEKQAPHFTGPVRVCVVSYRKRLVDTDGVSAKYVIDSLVDGEVLQDDRAEDIQEITFCQIPVGSYEEERAEIIIEDI